MEGRHWTAEVAKGQSGQVAGLEHNERQGGEKSFDESGVEVKVMICGFCVAVALHSSSNCIGMGYEIGLHSETDTSITTDLSFVLYILLP